MYRTLSKTVVCVLAVLFVISAVAIAADQKVSGTIESVDTAKGALTLQTTDGQTMQLQAPMELLSHLQTGDVVEVTKSGDKATAITKKE